MPSTYVLFLLTPRLVCQALSGTYFLLIAQSIFANRLLHALQTNGLNINAQLVLDTGASQIQQVFQGTDLTAVLAAYMVGIKDVFAFAMATAGLNVFVALAIPFKRLPDHSVKKTEDLDEEKSVEEKVAAV